MWVTESSAQLPLVLPAYPSPNLGIELDGPAGRFVRLELLDDHAGFDRSEYFLSLAEVQVVASPGAD